MRYLHICLAASMLLLAAWTSGATSRAAEVPMSPLGAAAIAPQAQAMHATVTRPNGAGWSRLGVRPDAISGVPEHGSLMLLGSALVLIARRLRRTGA